MAFLTQTYMRVAVPAFLASSPLIVQPALAGPPPTISCNGELVAWTDLRRDNLVAQVKQAEGYYMNSTAPDAGQSLSERRANLAKEISNIFSKALNNREKEYAAIKCHYHGIDWNKKGGSSWNDMSAKPGMVFDVSTADYTRNGDMKAGPNWTEGNTKVTWKTGGYGKSETYVNVYAVYPARERALADLDTVRAVLASQGIPTEQP